MTKKRSLASGNEPATRKDIDNLAASTKELVAKIDARTKELAAKIDTNTKDLAEVAATGRRTAVEVANIKAGLVEMKDLILTELRRTTRNIQEAAADFMARSEHDHRAVLFHGEGLTEVLVTLKSHEGRIQRLEASKHPA
jgi:hypothetical protein